MYNNLIGTVIDKRSELYKDFPDFLDGQVFIKYDKGFETRNNIVEESKLFLSKTDWYVIRFQETGVEIPPEIKKLRQEARERII